MIRRPMLLREYIVQTGQVPSGLELIRDTFDFKPLDVKRAITESYGGKVNVMRCTGVFQRADQRNANGRIYPYSILKEAVERLQNPIKERKVCGEYDHPADAKIHLDRISHVLTKLWMENKTKTVYGELEVINDERCPCGSMLACLLDRKIQVGISSRGVGDMELVECDGEEAYQVQNGFEFITFDAVAEPSVTGTQLKRIEESKKRKTSLVMSEDKKIFIRQARTKLLKEEIKSFLSL